MLLLLATASLLALLGAAPITATDLLNETSAVEARDGGTTPGLAWEDHWTVTGDGDEGSAAIAASPDGRIHVAMKVEEWHLRFSGANRTLPSNTAGVVASVAPDGSWAWIQPLTGSLAHYSCLPTPCEMSMLAEAHPDGGVVIAGVFYGSLRVAESQTVNHSSWASFVARLDASGSLVWLTMGEGQVRDLVVHPNGSVVIGGHLTEAISTFGSITVNGSASKNHGFVAWMDDRGSWTEIQTFVGSGHTAAVAVDFRVDHTVAVGVTSDGPVQLSNDLTVPGRVHYATAFVGRLTAGGQWSEVNWTNDSVTRFRDLVVTADDRVHVTGRVRSNEPVAFGDITTTAGHHMGGIRPYVATLVAGRWTQVITADVADNVADTSRIVALADDRLVISGHWSGQAITFGDTTLGRPGDDGSYAGFVALMDPDGTWLHARHLLSEWSTYGTPHPVLDVAPIGNHTIALVAIWDGNGTVGSTDLGPSTNYDYDLHVSTIGLDADRDGVSDRRDLCPGTAQGVSVETRGCSAAQLAVDDDGDGVGNVDDDCPDSSSGGTVDEHGCTLDQYDADGDGVPDHLDVCPASLAGDVVDVWGCAGWQRDLDGDGVSDAEDRCPSTPGGSTVGADGCTDAERDSDGDGVLDVDDGCPESNGTVDAAGCASDQRDTDADGVVDADDVCADTPAAEPVNASGCGPSHSDLDGDGISDASDQCGSTSNASGLDAFGCSDWDRDLDYDGVPDAADRCPATNLSALPDLDGCSADQRDTDDDGVVDALDACPSVAGNGTTDGCPRPPDRDADGVADAEDACPDAGSPSEVTDDGCPVSPKAEAEGAGLPWPAGALVCTMLAAAAVLRPRIRGRAGRAPAPPRR